MSKNIVARGATNDVTIWRIHVACWISTATCTYAHAHTDASGYPHARTHTRRPTSNTYWFSTETTVYFITRYKTVKSTSVHVTKHYSLLQHKLQDSKIYFSTPHKTLQSSSLGVRGFYFLERPSHPNVCKLLTDQKVLSFKTNYGTNKRQSN
jgi:hypothetical protein